MSELWICREQTAEVPFCLELADVEIRNLEELSYYLCHSMEWLDETVMGEPLFAWLAGELKLPRLAEALSQQRKQGRSAFWCAWFLLKEAGMYSEEELEEFLALSRQMEGKDEYQRQKLKADHLLANGRCRASILEYQKLLERQELAARDPVWKGNIHHNMGVAYARLFLFPEAAECFEQACRLNQDSRSYEARRETLELEEELKSAGIQEIQAAGGQTEGGGRPKEEGDWKSRIEQLWNEYRKKVN